MADKLTVLNEDSIRSKIHRIRGMQVILDEDLAELYDVETKRLNQAVRRNMERFPKEFMFQLTEPEFKSLRSQIVTLETETKSTSYCSKSQFATSKKEVYNNQDQNCLRSQIATLETETDQKYENNRLRSQIVILENGRGMHRKYLPYAFTEQGVAMLSGVLKSDIAIKISIQIMSAFVAMRRFISSNAQIFQRLDNAEVKLIEHDQNFSKIFDAIQNKDFKPEKGIFFDGQIFDAYTFVSDIIRSAKTSIILIDNYVDDTVLTLFCKRNKDVDVTIYTKEISKQLSLDVEKYNSQYPIMEVKEFKDSHDRFLIIDNKEVYHFGASLKDLGKKWFGFSKFDKEAFRMMERLGIS